MNWIIFILALFLIVFEAVPEGLSLSGSKGIAEIFEFVYLTIITLCGFAFVTKQKFPRFDYKPYFLRIIGGYILLRFALFDPVFNLSAGLPLCYIGVVKSWDQLWTWFFNWSGIDHVHFLIGFRFIALCVGTSWLLKRDEYRKGITDIITEYSSYKWYAFNVFVVLFALGVIFDSVLKVSWYFNVPFILFVLLLVVWFVLWRIAAYKLKKDHDRK